MKILFLAKNFNYNGGGERMLANLANRLADSHTIKIINFDENSTNPIFSIDKRIEVENANIKKRKINFFTKFDYYYYLKKYKDEINKFDIIIGVGIICNLILSLIANRINVKTIGWEHNSYEGVPLFQKVFRRLLYKRLSSIVILTRQDFIKYKKCNNNVSVIYNFSEKKMIEKKPENKFIFVGRLTKKKGYYFLRKIIKDFCHENRDWNFKIIGNGNCTNNFLRFIMKNNLKSRIEYERISSTVPEEIVMSKCMIMTSKTEGLPMVLIESQIYGVPAISFDTVTGPREIITNDRTGFIIPCYNTKLFVQKMLLYVNNQKVQTTFRTNCTIDSKRFTPNEIIKNWDLLFFKLMAKN